MTQSNRPSLSEIRARLRQGAEDSAENTANRRFGQGNSQSNQYYVKQQRFTAYEPESPGVERHKSFVQKMREGDQPKWLSFWQEHWIMVMTALAFCLPGYLIFAPESMLPGGQGVSVSSISPFLYWGITGTVFAIFAFLGLSKFQRMANSLHDVRRIGSKGPAFKIGAALGVAFFFYRFYNPFLGDLLPDPPSIADFTTLDAVKLILFAGVGGYLGERGHNMINGED